MLGILAILVLAFVLYRLMTGGEVGGYGPAAFIATLGTIFLAGLLGLVIAGAYAGLAVGAGKEGVTRYLSIAGIVAVTAFLLIPV